MGDDMYKLVKDKLTAEYNIQFETLRTILSDSEKISSIEEVELLLSSLSSLKMKLDILETAAKRLKNPSQQLLFG